MPLAIGLVRWYASTAESRETDRSERSETDTALRDLRNRYPRGELDDEEFENRVERLLETDSVADATSSTRREATAARTATASERANSRPRPPETTARPERPVRRTPAEPFTTRCARPSSARRA